MKNIFSGVASVIAVVIAIIAMFYPSGGSLGNKTASFWDAASYKVSGTEIVSSARVATVTGLTLSNSSATSTINAGLYCVQYYATSSATSWKMVPKLDGLGSSTSTPFTATYGTCP